MKKNVTLIVMVLLALLFVAATVAMAQVTTPPPPPGAGSAVGKYVATPIEGGVTVLLSMLGYGLYRLRRNK